MQSNSGNEFASSPLFCHRKLIIFHSKMQIKLEQITNEVTTMNNLIGSHLLERKLFRFYLYCMYFMAELSTKNPIDLSPLF